MVEPVSDTHHLGLAKSIRLRKEHFGGIAFDTETGMTLDLDRSAMALLLFLRDRGPASEEEMVAAARGWSRLSSSPEETVGIIGKLLEVRILEVAPATGWNRKTHAHEAAVDDWPTGPPLSAPETVHWAITYACDSGCPDCYAKRSSPFVDAELDTNDALRLVEKLAQWGVFQLAIGGGEPLQRPDLPTIAREAKSLGLVVHVTTGLHDPFADLLEQLAVGVTVLQFGIKADRLLASPRTELAKLRDSVDTARDQGLHVAANLMLSQSTLSRFEEVIELLAEAGLARITLLRYKPPSSVSRWQQEAPAPHAIGLLEEDLPSIIRRFPMLDIRVDCGFSFLQRNLTPMQALSAGIRGCVAANRILALAPDGSAYPCSQLVHPSLRAGNLLADDPDMLWAEAASMRRYREFRKTTGFRESQCGVCVAKEHCGGCRVFAGDGLGADPGCPGPVMPPLDKLGKRGRRVDLEQFLSERHDISVGEYMERYRVTQERAASELKGASHLAIPPQSSKGHKKLDRYVSSERRRLEDIQDSIGFTSGGFPFSGLEEIRESLGNEYPGWLEPDSADDSFEGEHIEDH